MPDLPAKILHLLVQLLLADSDFLDAQIAVFRNDEKEGRLLAHTVGEHQGPAIESRADTGHSCDRITLKAAQADHF